MCTAVVMVYYYFPVFVNHLISFHCGEQLSSSSKRCSSVDQKHGCGSRRRFELSFFEHWFYKHTTGSHSFTHKYIPLNFF
jgi:hypothetical protein